MLSKFTSRNRVGLLTTMLLVAGLSACGPQQPSSPEADAMQSTAGSSKPVADRT